jgi:hypothetical protein
MRRALLLIVLVAGSAANAACLDFLKDLTKPTVTTSAQSLNGTWATTQSLPGSTGSLANSCVNFTWSVTQISGSSGSGTFSATCMGNVQVAGSASGTLNGNTLTWNASATGTVPNLPPCQITLSGTATLEANNKIRIPYAGTTCLGPVSGTEVIQK